MNLFGPRNKVAHLKKLVFRSGVQFLFLFVFNAPCLLISVLELKILNSYIFKLFTCNTVFSKIHQRTLRMFKKASNQKKNGWHFEKTKYCSAMISNLVHLTFDVEAVPCLTKTKCNFRTFGVDESFWAKQQSRIS